MNKAITFARRVSTKSTIKILMIFKINNAAKKSLPQLTSCLFKRILYDSILVRFMAVDVKQ